MERGLVSVVIPAYNAERYVAEAIDSVLSQTYRPVEVIVVDDGSTDNTRTAAERYGSSLQYVFQANTGIGGARNRGVELARGNLLAFLDSDDVWVKDKLAQQTAALEANPQLDMVFGHVQQFLTPELADEIESKIRYVGQAMPGYSAGAMLVRRQAFLRVGFFDKRWEVGEFIDWYLRAMDLGLQSALQPEVMLRRRLHQSNQGRLKRDARTDYVRIVKAARDRRRKVRVEPANTDTG